MPTTGADVQKFGLQYEKCIGLTMTLADGVTPIPAFMTFSPLERTLKLSLKATDAGIYKLQVNFNYLDDNFNNSDPTKEHEHSVTLKVEVNAKV